MNNIISSRTNKSVQETHDDIAKEYYYQSTVQDLVIDHCIETGFITSTDVTTKTSKFAVLNETIETILNAFKLVDDFDDSNVTTDNFDAYIEYKKKLKLRIIKVISDRLLISLPDLRR
ncbi:MULTISPECIES: hypothetical protein [Vibrio harveyi group]|uniref:hypothetical protein n=1 Tax=Vibrio harveyi group TaxID=717610 RepID=UPI001A1D9F84|nr:hypothetical protein [Vibrio antiquarius]ELA6601882.1 hypothetical protein [Vibrio alginolyticus]MCG0026245.1 hypothetical protein [Vibrio parahaemolyticus]HAS8249904.1 hypothetical protein [Vibrio vulnificus]MCE9845031.1 hypothetical protein [Vibrio antiquarius]HCM0755555.1 hypothetical protein [Vibrio parahaemolyticus]